MAVECVDGMDGMVWHGMHGMAWMAWYGMAWMAWHGWHGMAWHGWHGCMVAYLHEGRRTVGFASFRLGQEAPPRPR